jgi:MFS family permease
MIAFRVLQGVFGAMLQPTALALLRNTFPIEKLNNAIGVWGAVIGASTAGGPIIGGPRARHRCCRSSSSAPSRCRPAPSWFSR